MKLKRNSQICFSVASLEIKRKKFKIPSVLHLCYTCAKSIKQLQDTTALKVSFQGNMRFFGSGQIRYKIKTKFTDLSQKFATQYEKSTNKTSVTFIFVFLIQDCSFNKLQDNTALKVSFQGNMRVIGDDQCNRWYFKFNGNECSGPMTIEAVVYNDWPSGNPNLLHHRSFEGYCENLARGTVTVELWVGSCIGHTQGDAYTGWNSVSRIMVEEVPRSQ